MTTAKLTFTGHETFYCRYLWLKKGYDFLSEKKQFNSEQAIVDLGVGKNMVNAIKFWMKAFGLTESINNQTFLTSIAEKIFNANGWDPFLEDTGTIWLLHYFLVKNQVASIYSIVFNDFRKEKTVFDKAHLTNYIKRVYDKVGDKNFNINTVEKDIGVFINNYVTKDKINSVEDDFSNFLSDLNLVQRKEQESRNSFFILKREKRKDLPTAIILFAILDYFENEVSISFKRLLNEDNSPGSVFLLHEDDLKKKIDLITETYPAVIYRENAGIGNLQIKGQLDKWEILDEYYAN